MTLHHHHTVSHASQQANGDFEMSSLTPLRDDHAADEPLISQPESDHLFLSAEPQSSGNVFIWVLTISACISGLLFGYDTGIISGTLVSIGSDLSDRQLTTLDKGLITACTSLFALIASPIAGILADRIGRKNIILFADGLFASGAIWQAFTSSIWGMILGRSIVGLAIGGASLIVPLYISELAPGHLRGRLVTVSSLFVTGGQVVAYIIGWAFSTLAGGWRWMVGLGAIPAILQLIILSFMPETPRHLARTRREPQAKAVLLKVYRGMSSNVTELVDGVILAIKKEILEEEEAHTHLKTASTRWNIIPPTLQSLLLHPPHARALTITCSLQGLQQLCGFNTLMYFSATIFQLLDFDSPTLTSLTVAGTNFVFTIVAFNLIDRLGRRRILLLTIPFMIISLLLCAASFSFMKFSDTSSADPTPSISSRLPAIFILISILIYVASYASGLGVVPWQQSELFPLSVRSLGSSLATATNWGCNTVVGVTFLPMMDFFTPMWTFVTYAVVCAIGWTVIWCIYPETMGLGLEEVGELLQRGWGVKESLERAKITTRRVTEEDVDAS